jgi:anti-sigma regulatory factor (Ser/Thr protein kinase)
MSREFTVMLAPGVHAPAEARKWLRTACAGWQSTAVEDARVLVSELVTNAVIHGEGDIRVRLSLSHQVLRVEVSDANPDLPIFVAPADVGDESGRGISMVNALARAWGSEPETMPAGKTIWFELERWRETYAT